MTATTFAGFLPDLFSGSGFGALTVADADEVFDDDSDCVLGKRQRAPQAFERCSL